MMRSIINCLKVPHLTYQTLKSILFILLSSIPGGIFYFLGGSTLVFWLNDLKFDKATIGLFSFAGIFHGVKFLWGPVLERVQNDKLVLIVSLSGCMACLFLLTLIDPVSNTPLFFCVLMILSIFSASYKMMLHACQMALVQAQNWGLTEAACTTGFRIGMIASGAGALYLSAFMPWVSVYRLMILLCIPSLIWIMFSSPQRDIRRTDQKYLWRDAFVDFFHKKDWMIVLGFMLLYRLQDDFLGKMPNLFFIDMGFSKQEISIAYKLGGLLAVTIGGFLGGYLCFRFKYRPLFFWGLLLHGVSGGAFLILNVESPNVWALYLVVTLQEFTKGLILAPFFSYQLASCTKKFCITQIALLTSIVTFPRILLGGISGVMATNLGWSYFFIFSSLLCVPVLFFVRYIPEYHKKND